MLLGGACARSLRAVVLAPPCVVARHADCPQASNAHSRGRSPTSPTTAGFQSYAASCLGSSLAHGQPPHTRCDHRQRPKMPKEVCACGVPWLSDLRTEELRLAWADCEGQKWSWRAGTRSKEVRPNWRFCTYLSWPSRPGTKCSWRVSPCLLFQSARLAAKAWTATRRPGLWTAGAKARTASPNTGCSRTVRDPPSDFGAPGNLRL